MRIEIKLNQEQFDILLTAIVQIAQGCVRMADAWDTTQKVTTPNVDGKPKRSYQRHKDSVSIETIFRELGRKQDRGLFRAACKLAGVEPYYHNPDSKCHRLYIPIDSKDKVVSKLKSIIG